MSKFPDDVSARRAVITARLADLLRAGLQEVSARNIFV
ncbi:MAG: hypothetical protein OJF51_004251 [Nitrospira sp.]|nr:MAG: hypothetical protein OJF51_004251 [Nitrospira sp.]